MALVPLEPSPRDHWRARNGSRRRWFDRPRPLYYALFFSALVPDTKRASEGWPRDRRSGSAPRQTSASRGRARGTTGHEAGPGRSERCLRFFTPPQTPSRGSASPSPRSPRRSPSCWSSSCSRARRTRRGSTRPATSRCPSATLTTWAAWASTAATATRRWRRPPTPASRPTKTCMNCHSQIWNQTPDARAGARELRSGRSIEWVPVHDLPDFVYFDHSIHVNKGVGCSTCHGRVDEMPYVAGANSLHMEWCLECHRAPERFLRPPGRRLRHRLETPGTSCELGPRLVERTT